MRRRSIHGVPSLLASSLAVAATVLLSAGAYAATIQADKADYVPGESVAITGSGWQPGELVTLQVLHSDGTVEGGAGHDPWTVTADGGSFTTEWYVAADDSLGSSFLLTAVGASGQTASTTFTDRVGLNLDQCQNGTLANLGVPCGQAPTSWANGDINAQNSQYREADGIPYRVAITGIPDGTWTIRLQYDFTKGGVYALDRLTRFNLTQNSNPCLSAPSNIACTAGTPSFDFLMPGEVVAPATNAPALPNGGALDIAGTTANLTAADRRMTVWVQGGAGSFVSAGQNGPDFNDGHVLQSGPATGDSSREFAFRVLLSGCPASGSNPGCSLLLGWTGHVAASRDWGPGLGASGIGGAPFHMRILGVDQTNGTSGGNQDRSVQLAAIVDTGTIVIVKNAVPDNAQDFSFSGTLGSFSLDDDADATLPNSQTFSGVEAGVYTVGESSLPDGWVLTSLVCVDPSANSLADLGAATASIDLEGGETVTCTFTNTNETLLHPCSVANCDDGNACTDDACNEIGGVAVCSHTNNTSSCDDGLFCNGTDTCSGGECTHAGDPCEGGGEQCDPGSNSCVECLTDANCVGGEVCSPTSNTCVECITNENCDGGAPVCDSGTNTCVPCTGDEQCTGDLVCDTSSGSCAECTPGNEAACVGGEVCSPSTGTCVECIADENCSGELICDTSSNTCVECTPGREEACTSEQFCDPSSDTCVQCITNEDCASVPGLPACDLSTNTCVECVPGDSDFCGDDAVCDPQSHTCVECLDDEDCQPGTPVCDPATQTCRECSPENLSACETGELCNPSNGTCVECLSNDDCSAGSFCSGENTCVSCLSDADCEDHNDCTADTCNPSGECEHPPAECSVVTDSSLCRFDEYEVACQGGREFRLVFTPDVRIWPAYKLNSSNPGQTYYNLIAEGETPVTVAVPYPYVTVGAMPVHVYCADDLQYDGNGCFVPPIALAAYPLQISMMDWAPGGRCQALQPTFGDDAYPAGAGICRLEVPLPPGQCDGRYYVNLHLDYGLKGAPARYDAVGMSAWGSSVAYVNADAPLTPSVVAINDCTPYNFADTGSGKSDTVYSTNVFKRIAGVFSQIVDNGTGGVLTGVRGSLKLKATGELVATATSDDDGYMMLNYKHTGKAAVYTVSFNVPGWGVVSADLTLRANGWAEASFDVATGSWFVISSADK